jgi:hypothetical protein
VVFFWCWSQNCFLQQRQLVNRGTWIWRRMNHASSLHRCSNSWGSTHLHLRHIACATSWFWWWRESRLIWHIDELSRFDWIFCRVWKQKVIWAWVGSLRLFYLYCSSEFECGWLIMHSIPPTCKSEEMHWQPLKPFPINDQWPKHTLRY